MGVHAYSCGARSSACLNGTGISPGLATGRAFIYQDILERPLLRRKLQRHQVNREYERIQSAVRLVRKDLRIAAHQVRQTLGEQKAGIFAAQETMLLDATLAEELRRELDQQLVNAEHAVKSVFQRWHQRFGAISDKLLRENADDMLDLWRRMLRALVGINLNVLEDLPAGSVVVAKHLVPSDTVLLSRQATAAVVVEFGGTTSHAALLTREFGIPAVTGIADLLDHIAPGDVLLVDGSSGAVLARPDQRTRRAFEMRIASTNRRSLAIHQRAHEPARTVDGIVVKVMANVGGREDVAEACARGADGVGLYRLESFYLSRKTLPSSDDLLEHLSFALEPAKGNPITIRLLDIGADKRLPYLDLAADPLTHLGRRAIRLLLEQSELLRSQLSALLRLSRKLPVQILVPMVTLPREMEAVRAMARVEARRIGVRSLPPIGAMVETPAAALCVRGLLNCSDFVSVGTNDLTQYTLAVGRENQLVQEYFDDRHPAVLKLMQIVARSVGKTRLSLCGELAANPDATRDILSVGFRILSVAPSFVPLIKDAVRHVSIAARGARRGTSATRASG